MKGSYDRAGGAETLLDLILDSENSARWQRLLVLLEGRGHPGAALGCRPRLVVPWRGIATAPAASRRLAGLAREQQASLLHSNDMRSDLAAWLLRRTARVPWLAHMHGWLGATHAGRHRLFEAVDRRLVRSADLVVVGSSAARTEVEQIGASRIRLIPNAVRIPRTDGSPDAAATRAALGIGAGEVVAGVLGRVHPGKGQACFVQALALLRARGLRARGLVVGEGPALEAVRTLAREAGLASAVAFTGFVADRWPYLAAMDVAVVPSLKESLPLVALEAMGIGKPVVASRVGDLADVIEEGRSGLLVPPGDPAALAAALAPLLTSAEMRRSFGERGSRIVGERHEIGSLVRGLDEAYGEALANYRSLAGG